MSPAEEPPERSDTGVPSHDALSRGELQNRAIRGALWTVVHTAVSLPIAFLVNILLARVLGVVDYGRLAYLSTVMDVVGGVIALGIGAGLVQFGAKAHATGRTSDVQQLLSSTQGFRLLIQAPVLTVVVIAVAQVDVSLLLIALVFGIWIPSALDGAPACFAIENKTASGARNAMLVNIVTQAAVVLMALLVGTADAIWATRLTIGALAVAMALPIIAPQYRRAILRPSLPRRFPPGFWRFALPAGAAGLIGSLVVSRTEVVILTWMSATEAAGIFALAFGLANHLFGPAQALIGPLVPAVSGLREVDLSALARALARTMRASSTIVAMLVASALPAFAVLVPAIYGQDFEHVPEVMLALGVAGGVLIIAGPVQAFVQARLSGTRLLWVNIVALLVDVILAVALIPPLGVWGAVIANIGAASTQLGLLLIGEVRATGLGWGTVLASTSPTVIGGVACLGAWYGSHALAWTPLLTAVAAGSLGLVLLAVGLRVTRSGLAPGDTAAILASMSPALSRLARPVLQVLTQSR